MTRPSITVIIPPEIADGEECYDEVVGYVAACTRLTCIRDGLTCGDSATCDAYFEDDAGNRWHGQLSYPSYPDGSQKYIIDPEQEAGEQ